MKSTLKKLSIPKPNGGFDELYTEDFITKEKLNEQIAELKKLIYRLHFETDDVTDLHPFYIKSLEDDNVVYNSNSDCRLATHAADVEYSYGYSWMNLGDVETIALNEGEKVYFRYVGSEYLSGEVLTSTTKTFDVGGDIRTVIYGNTKVESVLDYEFEGLFSGTNVVNANQLMMAFKSVGKGGCDSMFSGCTSLVSAPELPAMELAGGTDEEYNRVGCYRYMFSGCTSLVNAPELPATTLVDYCYENMFSGCTSLVNAPELPATTLGYGCYRGMFQGCTSLTKAQELPATTLVDYCYENMFSGCTSLVQAPELPATTLANGCYSYMFQGCTSLTQAPELFAPILVSWCYENMFYGCSKLNYVKCMATDITAQNCITNWLNGVAETGTFVRIKESGVEWEYGESGIPTGWEVKDEYLPYVTFTAEESGSTIGLNKLSSYQTLEYSTNTLDWTSMTTSTNIKLNNVGDIVYIRGVLNVDNTDTDFNYTHFKMTGKIAASGNCNALWNYNDLNAPLKVYCGYCMFMNCTSLTQAPELPATTLTEGCYRDMFLGCTSLTTAPELQSTTLAESCYEDMFNGCTNLTTAPELPATTLAGWCYDSMFQSCTSLTQAPELPATTLAHACYNSMFSGCTSLNQAPELPATTLAEYCYGYMFNGCTNLTQAQELPATTLADYCYWYMFLGCTSLTQAPELPATTLADGCYIEMFQGCISLTQAPELPATTLADYCYRGMFSNCAGLTQAPELPATTLADYCYRGMFSNCTSLTTAPELPAATLESDCYSEMFSGCSNLNYIKCLATDISATFCTTNWVNGVSETGTFIKSPDTSWQTGVDGTPSGWEVIDDGDDV